ncbi:MAG: ECF transporter S component [Fusobacteriaceae bacterium]
MNKTKNIALVGILGALAFITMLLEIPYPIAPWLKFDVSDVITLFGGFLGGYSVAALIAVVKIILNLTLHGTTTSGIGEATALIATLAFVFPTIYIYEKSRKIIFALAIGTLAMTLVMLVGNYFYITPFYARLYKMDFILDMMNKKDGTYLKYIVSFYGAFNIFKGIILSVIYLIVHKTLQKKYRCEIKYKL